MKKYDFSYCLELLPYEEKTNLNSLASNIFSRNRINQRKANKLLVSFEKKLIKLYKNK